MRLSPRSRTMRGRWRVDVEGRSLEVVIGDPAHQGQGLLTHRQQALSLRGHRGAESAVRMDYPVEVG